MTNLSYDFDGSIDSSESSEQTHASALVRVNYVCVALIRSRHTCVRSRNFDVLVKE